MTQRENILPSAEWVPLKKTVFSCGDQREEKTEATIMRNFNFNYTLIIHPEKDHEHKKTFKINIIIDLFNEPYCL